MKTRIELANFIRRVADSEHDPDEWQDFIVAHYEDEKMEEARREMARLTLENGWTSGENTPAVLELARRLGS